MQKIGTIQFVQVQRESLKDMDGETRFYNPNPLSKVAKLKISPTGIIGITEQGEEFVDVHNESHPRSRYRGDNRLSFGFLQQYERMRARFGDHLKDGIAAENIIVNAEIDILNWDSSRRYFIKHDDELIELKEVIPAPPCREFSVFCLIVPQCADDIKAALQFLSDGTRGYYADLAVAGEYVVQAGDSLMME